MGGRIGVESVPGVGSTFWFTIACRKGEKVDRMEVTVADSAIDETGPLRVLVAEDNEVNQKLVQAILEKAGHDVVIVADGREAVRAVRSADYDLVLMDVQMPEMDGLAATREIRGLSGPAGRVPIVALTANALSGQKEEYLSTGMDDYVTKPIVPRTLFRAIARTLRKAAHPATETTDVNSMEDTYREAAMSDSDDGYGETIVADEDTTVPLFDQEARDELVGTIGEEAFRSLLAIVPEEADRYLQDIEEAFRAGDLALARKAAHSLKGMASSCTAIRIASAAREIERGVDANALATETVYSLAAAIEETKDWLRQSA
jgi:CheY-like chemotaxis protein/HPt (histidine-containing phosphotransfer) domain-containing protein